MLTVFSQKIHPSDWNYKITNKTYAYEDRNLRIQSWAHLAYCTMVTGDSFWRWSWVAKDLPLQFVIMWFIEMSRHLHQILLQEGIAAAANNLQGVYKSIFELAHTFVCFWKLPWRSGSTPSAAVVEVGAKPASIAKMWSKSSRASKISTARICNRVPNWHN